MTKLSEENIEEICMACANWEYGDGAKFAKKFGVTRAAISVYKIACIGARIPKASRKKRGKQ